MKNIIKETMHNEAMRNLEAMSTAKMLSWANDYILETKVRWLETKGRPACVMLDQDEEVQNSNAWPVYQAALFDAEMPKQIELAELQLETDIELLARNTCCVCQRPFVMGSFCLEHEPKPAERSTETLLEGYAN
jgi:hypothetical protein